MRIRYWSSDVCSSDLPQVGCRLGWKDPCGARADRRADQFIAEGQLQILRAIEVPAADSGVGRQARTRSDVRQQLALDRAVILRQHRTPLDVREGSDRTSDVSGRSGSVRVGPGG